jgi:tripartite-type tricarboxylate transporter receptor subunit TctC
MKRFASKCRPLFLRRCAAALLLSAILPALAWSQSTSYPIKPIRMLVPFTPGGGTDIIARTMAVKLSEALKQSVIVDNRPGGGGTVGVETAVRAAPDGYTMLMVSASYGTNAALFALPFDPIQDVTAVSMIGESSFIVGVHPGVAAKSIKELATYAKANPGKLNYATAGTGGITHMGTVLFELLADAPMTHVPYKGTGPALNDLIGGQVHLMFGAMPALLPHIKTGRVRALAVTAAKRSSLLPELPTIAETIAGYEAPVWYGLLGPKGLPGPVVTLWSAEIHRAAQSKDWKERMSAEGFETGDTSSARFTETIKRDVAKWKRVVKDGNIRFSA